MTECECPICMDEISGNCNRVVTECGHIFHCSCLMQNTAHNGFGCPYCRTIMAEEPKEEYEEDEDDYSTEESLINEDTFASFRMFHQRINGEEVEEEPDDEWIDDEEDEEEEPDDEMPSATYVAQKLVERGLTIVDLVKDILFQEHSRVTTQYNDYELRSCEVYGNFRAIISQYRPQNQVQDVPQTQVQTQMQTQVQTQVLVAPEIAETKTINSRRRSEHMIHV